MKFASTLPFIALFGGAMVPGAQAGQIFSFQNPIPNGSYSNAMFETTSLFPGGTFPIASIQNIYSGTVGLDVTNFTSTGGFAGTSSYTAKYFLSQSGSNTNSTFNGNVTSGVYATGSGVLTFVDPTSLSKLLQISFTSSSLSFGNFAAAGTIGFSGSLLTTGEKGNENASFGFPNRYTLSGSQTDSIGHHTGSFTSSIGTVGAVPEPAPMVALAAGSLAFLRRRRR